MDISFHSFQTHNIQQTVDDDDGDDDDGDDDDGVGDDDHEDGLPAKRHSRAII